MNAVEIEEAVSKLASEPFDPKTFPYAFLEAFGNKPTTIAKLKKRRVERVRRARRRFPAQQHSSRHLCGGRGHAHARGA